MVEKQLTSGVLVSPSGELFLSPFFLLAAVLDPKKAHLGKKSGRNICVTGSAVVRPETALGCGGFGYDKALGSSAYAWVDEDRMASVTGPGVSVSYEYDADGRRVKETSGGASKQYLIDRMLPYGQVVLETDGAGDLNASFTYGLERISQSRGGVTHVYLADGQGSIRQLTDTTGSVSDTWDYTAFGELLARTGTTENRFTYTGEEFDPNSGFSYLRARWMDPGTGRFASVDPFAGDRQTPVSLHRYLYANASPVNFTDPSGETPLTDFIRVAGRFLGSYAVPTVLGTFIHYRICEDIQAREGVGNVGCFDPIPGVGVPDVVLRKTKEVYEIKPEGGYQGPEQQLVRYTTGTGFVRGITPLNGTVHAPPPIFVMDVEYYTAGPGEIYYIPRINRTFVATSFSVAAAYSITRVTTAILGRLAIPSFGFAF